MLLVAAAVLLLGAASARAADPVIAAAGDMACDPADSNFKSGNGTSTACRQKYTSNLLVGAGLSTVLALGDNQYDNGSLSNYQASYHPSWGRVKSITRPVPGNHEPGNASGYYDYFNGSGVDNGAAGQRGKGWYSYDLGSWHLIALNSKCDRVPCTAGGEQEQWLRADLAAHPDSCTLAYWHHARFSSGHDGDNSVVQPLWRALYDAQADVVLNGHSHNYERFAPMDANGNSAPSRGIREFVVGTGGAFFTGISSGRPNSVVRQNHTFGVLKLTFHPSSYDWQFVPEAGKTFTDSGSDSCHGSGAPPAADTQAPTVPANLAGTAVSSTQVNLSWGASTDNVAVTGYEIYRDDSLLTTRTGTSYSDTVGPDTPYSYRVRALDAAGNRSAFGNTATVTTPSASPLTLAPVADARVEESSPSTNYGTSYLRTDGGSDSDVDSYLRFVVSGIAGSIQSAKLRVYAYSGTVDGPAVYTTGTGWSESGITWASRPAPTSGAAADKGAVSANSWVEYDVAPFVTGNGTYSFRLATTSPDGIEIRSREDTDASLRPELVLTPGRGNGDGQPPQALLHPPGPFSPLGVDKLAPRLTIDGPRTQRLVRRAVFAVATCNEQCSVTATARVSLGRESRSFRSRKVKRVLSAGARSRLRLRFSRRAVRTVRRALRRKRHLFAEVTVHSRDPAGNSSTARHKIRLKS